VTVSSSGEHDRPLANGQKGLIILAVLVAYGSSFWPGHLVLGAGMEALGNPEHQGFVGIFLPHLLLYSTLTAFVCAALWAIFVRSRLLPSLELENAKRAVLPGVIGGLLALALTLSVVAAAFPAGMIHWIAPDPWKIAGNVFSNFFEEFVYRGFFLVALRRVLGFWPAALLSSAMWAFTHTQYPVLLQGCILITGVGFCWLARYARSLWAPYFAHEALDIIGDSLIG
jgi:membrane protease YdiL (CAAX protease family)